AARLLTRIAYPEMLELASAGARVIHPRAVEIAEAFSMELHVRSSFHAGSGTIICSEEAIMEDRNRVRGIAHEEHVARLSMVGVPDRPGIAAAIFAPLAEADIAADVIVQTASHEGITDMSFTVSSADGREARSEEHTSELQSRFDLVCRLLLEKKKKHNNRVPRHLQSISSNLDFLAHRSKAVPADHAPVAHSSSPPACIGAVDLLLSE